MLSDDSTSDSDCGIRFKTDSTRREPSGKDKNVSQDRRRERDPRDFSYPSRNDARTRDRSDLRSDKYSGSRSRTESSRTSHSSKRPFDDDKYSSNRKHRRRTPEEDDRKRDKALDTSSSRSSRNEADRHSSNDHRTNSDKREHVSREKPTHVRVNDEFASKMRNAISRHLNLSSKTEKSNVKSQNDHKNGNGDGESSNKNDTPQSNSSVKHKSQKKDQPNDIPQIDSDEDQVSSNRHNSKPIDRFESEHESDVEQKPVSYYNMVCGDSQDKDVSDSDESDEEALRKKALVLIEKIKSAKVKKKKHKEKKKSKRSKDSSEKDKSISGKSSSVLSSSPGSSSRKEKVHLGNESNEEGEIVSDSDEKNCKANNARKSNKSQLPDLREKLSSKVSNEIQGPALPPRMRNDDEDVEIEGPALPPHLKNSNKDEKSIGPTISEAHRKLLESETKTYTISDDETSDDNVEVVGPLPQGSEDKWSTSHRKLEERALKLKMKSLDGHSLESSKADVREEWMMKLPEARGLQLGLTSRQFRAREGPDMSDRSSWTDTPEEKALKAAGIYPEDSEADSNKIRQSAETQFIKQRDEEQEDAIKKHKKKNKRDMSLLEIHEKKLRKKKKKSEDSKEKVERRRFDRDIDLKANRFDEAQKKAILKKAQLLDTRFSKGEAKYL